MKILSLYSYTYPENIASSHLKQDLCCAFAKEGISIEGYAPVPSRGLSKIEYNQHKKIKYLECYDGMHKFYRFSMFREKKSPLQRAFRYICCAIMHYQKGKNAKDVDLIYCSSTPPINGIVCTKIKNKLTKKYGRDIPFLYNLQDIFPDSLVTTGMTKEGSLLWRLGRKIENYTYQRADKIIVISQSMKNNIMTKGVPEEKIEVISNWIDTEEVKPVKKDENDLFKQFSIPHNKYIVVYAGNFGEAQGADVILKAAELLRDNTDIQFVVFGGGSKFDEANTFVKVNKLTNVIMNGLLPNDKVSQIYSVGDVAIITCKKGAGSSAMPSKTWSIMACNTPIIASFDKDSELSKIIAKANAGVCIDPENAELLAETILNMKNSKFLSFSREYVIANVSKERCLARYIEVINSVKNNI